MTGWAESVEPVTCAVFCCGEVHDLCWNAGSLKLANHDLDAELALRALGGRSCTCLEVFDLWQSRIGAEEVYALWTTTAEWPSGSTAIPSGQATLAQRLSEDRRHSLMASLPLALRRRRALQAMAELPARGEPIRRIVASLATPAVLASLPITECGSVDVRVCLAEGAAQLSGEVARWGGWVRLDVSPRWVPDVWATGRVAIGQSAEAPGFVLDAFASGDGGAALRIARWVPQGDRWRTETVEVGTAQISRLV